tara:strand:- start:97979 stop:98344 length:366 start_codon:yes stop_codon:yes gene_type:complete
MKSYKLSFGTIIIIEEHLAEVIINDDVVIDGVMVDEYHDFLLTALKSPFSLLINKKHSYTYTFYAQKTFLNLKAAKAMAVLVYNKAGVMSIETLINLNATNNWNIQLFQSRDEAFNWLERQ